MKTCKECLYQPICNAYASMGVTDLPASDISPCGFFKNKADFVEVKHGEWVRQKGRPEAICSECGREVVYQSIDNKWWFENYCPYCGGDMRNGGEDK